MDVAYISTLSALAGSFVGGLTSTGTTWLTQRAQTRAARVATALTRREDLYREFITVASKAYGDALVSSEAKLPDVVGLYSMISQMRIVSLPRTVARADNVMRTIIDTYYSPNLTTRELRDLIKGGASIDLLRDFAEAAREEIRLFKAE
jgi:hypothetical protein